MNWKILWAHEPVRQNKYSCIIIFFDKTTRSAKTGNGTENQTSDQPEIFMEVHRLNSNDRSPKTEHQVNMDLGPWALGFGLRAGFGLQALDFEPWASVFGTMPKVRIYLVVLLAL